MNSTCVTCLQIPMIYIVWNEWPNGIWKNGIDDLRVYKFCHESRRHAQCVARQITKPWRAKNWKKKNIFKTSNQNWSNIIMVCCFTCLFGKIIHFSSTAFLFRKKDELFHFSIAIALFGLPRAAHFGLWITEIVQIM